MSICDLSLCFLTAFYQFGTSCPGGAAGSSAGQSRLTLMDKPSDPAHGLPHTFLLSAGQNRLISCSGKHPHSPT